MNHAALAAWPHGFELAVVFLIFALGNILFGHFEAGTPKSRRITKVFLVGGAAVGASHVFGPAGFWALLGAGGIAFLVVHGWWLPRHGINGWTGEPRDRYHALRGWPRVPRDEEPRVF